MHFTNLPQRKKKKERKEKLISVIYILYFILNKAINKFLKGERLCTQLAKKEIK